MASCTFRALFLKRSQDSLALALNKPNKLKNTINLLSPQKDKIDHRSTARDEAYIEISGSGPQVVIAGGRESKACLLKYVFVYTLFGCVVDIWLGVENSGFISGW